jgi:hypothetical protein
MKQLLLLVPFLSCGLLPAFLSRIPARLSSLVRDGNTPFPAFPAGAGYRLTAEPCIIL